MFSGSSCIWRLDPHLEGGWDFRAERLVWNAEQHCVLHMGPWLYVLIRQKAYFRFLLQDQTLRHALPRKSPQPTAPPKLIFYTQNYQPTLLESLESRNRSHLSTRQEYQYSLATEPGPQHVTVTWWVLKLTSLKTLITWSHSHNAWFISHSRGQQFSVFPLKSDVGQPRNASSTVSTISAMRGCNTF